MARLVVLPFGGRLHLDGQRQWVFIHTRAIPSLDLFLSVPETGGLLRIAIKLMMVCATDDREM